MYGNVKIRRIIIGRYIQFLIVGAFQSNKSLMKGNKVVEILVDVGAHY